MKFERTRVWGFEHAFRGMRNPKNSWHLSDSHFDDSECHFQYEADRECEKCNYFSGFNAPCKPLLGEKDRKLAQSLIRGGSEHRKFLRQIFVSVDITAPLYWWSEADTYKVGTTANSTSTMHKVMSRRFTPDMFECEGMRGFKQEVRQLPNEIDEDTEEWRPYPGDANYLVSNQGRVKHLSYVTTHGRAIKERTIAGSLHKDGYIFVSMVRGNSEYKQVPKHRLVAETWIDNPENKPEVNHKDGNKMNNAVENLEWATRSENQLHAIQHNLQPIQTATYKGKLSREEREQILNRYAVEDVSVRELAQEYKVSHTTIYSLLHNKYNYGDGYENEFQTFLHQLDELNDLRDEWLITQKKEVWKTLIEKLPRNWLQMRTVTMSYENIFSMVRQRKNHKLNEWSGKDNPALENFIAWAHTLPLADELIFLTESSPKQRAKVICISGQARAGKDTAAGMIQEALEAANQRVLITHYADLLKFMCRSLFGWDGQKDEAGRHILQYVGTDIIRKQEPDFWVEFVIKTLKLFPDKWDYVLIPDTRFPNEINELKKAGFDVYHIHITRPVENGLTEEQRNHPSEIALNGVVPDETIENNGGLEELRRRVQDAVAGFLPHQPAV